MLNDSVNSYLKDMDKQLVVYNTPSLVDNTDYNEIEKYDRLIKASNISDRYKSAWIKDLIQGKYGDKTNMPKYLYLDNYLLEFSRESSSLWFYGDTSTSKTHTAIAVALELLYQGFRVYYTKYPEMAYVNLNHDKDDRNDYKSKILNADLLILDDLDINNISEYNIMFLQDIVDHRYSNRQPTIFISNKEPKSLNFSFNDRIMHSVNILNFSLQVNP